MRVLTAVARGGVQKALLEIWLLHVDPPKAVGVGLGARSDVDEKDVGIAIEFVGDFLEEVLRVFLPDRVPDQRNLGLRLLGKGDGSALVDYPFGGGMFGGRLRPVAAGGPH